MWFSPTLKSIQDRLEGSGLSFKTYEVPGGQWRAEVKNADGVGVAYIGHTVMEAAKNVLRMLGEQKGFEDRSRHRYGDSGVRSRHRYGG